MAILLIAILINYFQREIYMKELAIIFILVVLSIVSFYLHYKKEKSTKLNMSHASRRRTRAALETFPELTEFLPVELNQLYEHDLLKVGQSPRHTVISCCLIIKKINQLHYPERSLSTEGLIKQLLADGYITQDLLAWYATFEAFDDGDLTKIADTNIVNNAANLKAFICKLLHTLYVTPEYSYQRPHPSLNNSIPEGYRLIDNQSEITKSA